MKSTASTCGSGSIVVDVGRCRRSWGFCRSGSYTSVSHALLDRVWRRSSCFLHKPEMEWTCCPSSTILLSIGYYVLFSEQLCISKSMQRSLYNALDAKISDKFVNDPGNLKDYSLDSAELESLIFNHEENNTAEQYMSSMIDNAILSCIQNGVIPGDIQLPKACVKKVVQAKNKLLIQGFEDLLYSSTISFLIASALRKAEKDEHFPKLIARKLGNYMDEKPKTYGLSSKACIGHINFYLAAKQCSPDDVTEILAVCKKKSPAVHISKTQKLEIRLKKLSFDPEKYELHRKYQIVVHNDTADHVSKSSSIIFLVESPLGYVPPNCNINIPPCGFGSFHQKYLLKGRLVAVEVKDMLPKCFLHIYLSWILDSVFLSLGKYSALQEIGWLIENQVRCPCKLGYDVNPKNHTMEGGKGKKVAREASYLPEEILLHHIFLKLPIEDVTPCKYVCKAWNRVIQDPEFAALHFNQNRHHYSKKLLIKDEHNKFYSTDYNQAITSKSSVLDASKLKSWTTEEAAYSESPRLLGSQNGLVLVQICSKLLLWNPTTRESKMIRDPDPPLQQYHLFGLAYDSAADDYKIVRSISDFPSFSVVVDVYSLRNDSWKIVKSADIDDASYWLLDFRNPSPVEVNGYMYWMTSHDQQIENAAVFGFSLSQEKLNRVHIVNGWPQFPFDQSQVRWGLAALGKQALAAYMYWKEYGLFWVYTMEEPDTNNPEPMWSDLIKFDVSKHDLDPLLTTSIKPLLITDQGNILLLITYGSSLDQKDCLNLKYGLYDPQQDHLQHIQINGLPGCTSLTDITYLQSLVSPNYAGRLTRSS